MKEVSRHRPAPVVVPRSQIGFAGSLQLVAEAQGRVHTQCCVGPGPGQHRHAVPEAQDWPQASAPPAADDPAAPAAPPLPAAPAPPVAPPPAELPALPPVPVAPAALA